MDYAASAGLKAVMTADTHVRCTTRTAEAMLKIEEMTGQRADMDGPSVQGDDTHDRPRHDRTPPSNPCSRIPSI